MSNATLTPTPEIQVQARKPSESLRDLVHCFFWTQLPAPSSNRPPKIARMLPHAGADIILCEQNPLEIVYRGQSSVIEGAMLSGPFLTTPTFRWSGSISNFGIRLRHGALGRLLPFAAKRMVNKLMPLSEIWTKEQCQRLQQAPLVEAQSFEEKIQIAENVISECFAKTPPADSRLEKAVKAILESKGRIGVTELAAQIGVSRQTLKSKFDQAIGFAPKLFSRLCRFQNTLRVLYRSGRNSWTDLAQECGYYDQAHLIREFNHFTGFSPERLLRDIARSESIYYFDQAEQTMALIKDPKRMNLANI